MNTHIELESFFIVFNEKQYECMSMEKNGRMIYQIKFPGSCIYLTQAKTRDGEKFWTAIPPDSKLNHIVPILGKQIENKKS
jgi:hypothetical protein